MRASIANYDVVSQLGEGGMGCVYEAIHRPSGTVVAIKTLRDEMAPSSQRLLLDEAVAAAQMAHPNIVELLDVGRDDDGAMFLVMELVRGENLGAWANAFPGMRAVLRAFGEILDALATAHAAGIVHGDLKPANVLLSSDGHVKLTDFGVAHVIDPLRKEEKRRVQGTPFYMAPEQIVDPSAIGPATDLYAIGVMLYVLLGVSNPYGEDTSIGAVIARKGLRPEPFVPRAGLALPPVIEFLIMSLLDPDPRTRPRFAARVRDALAAIAVEMDASTIDGRASSQLERAKTIADAPTHAKATTIRSAPQLPHDTRPSVSFEQPAMTESGTNVSLRMLRPLPLVGRREQTERLLATAHDVIAGRGARVVLFSGRAGEGKTRLVRQGFAEVERTGAMLGAAASFDDTLTSSQVGLHACMTRLLGPPLRSARETLEGPWRWLSRVPQPGVDFVRACAWLSSDAPLEPKPAAEVASQCLLAASRVFPIYLWLDDVAWSRDGAMELVLRLLERDDARVLAVGTLRSGTAEHPAVREWLDAAVAAGARHEILGSLDAADRAELVAAAAPVSRDVAARIASELDEPALVLVETARAMVEDGTASRGGVARPVAVLGRRVASLLEGFGNARDDAERILIHAALLGLRFEDRALRASSGASKRVDAVLDRALLSGLLRVDRRGAYRFEHRLFLDAIVERCNVRADANAIRRATADALSRTYGRDIETSLAAAKLYHAGGDLEAAMRHAAESVAASVRGSLFEWAASVLDLMRSWVAGLPSDHFLQGFLETAYGTKACFELDYPEATQHCERALEIFRRTGKQADVHAAMFHLSSAYFYADRFAEAERCVEFVNEPVVDTLSHGRAHHRLAELASMRGDLVKAIDHERRASEHCDIADVHLRFLSYMTLVDLQVCAGLVDDAVAMFEEARELSESLPDRTLASELEHSRAVIDVARGDFTHGRERARHWLAGLVDRGDKWQQTTAFSLVMLCTAALGDEDMDAAVFDFTRAYSEVPHDEAITWWTIRAAADRLRARGRDDLAGKLAAMLDARVAKIRAAWAR